MPDQKKTGQIIIIILQVYWITVNFEHVHGLNLIFTKSNYISRWEKFHHEVQGEFTKCEFSSPSDSRTSPSVWTPPRESGLHQVNFHHVNFTKVPRPKFLGWRPVHISFVKNTSEYIRGKISRSHYMANVIVSNEHL